MTDRRDHRPIRRPASRVLALALLTAAVALAAAPSAALAGASHAAKPNVLILLADDQRADTIAALGNARLRTPHLDRLVREGTTFTRAYCMGSDQGAVCVPSRAMLLSGRTLFRVHEDLDGQPTWPESFAAAGYATFLTGKWHNGAASALRAFQQGQAVFLGGMGDPYRLPLQDISSRHTFANYRASGAHSVKLFADAAVEFLRGRTGDRPFLCYVAFNLPHDPRTAPPAYHARHRDDPPPPPANFLPQHPFDNGATTIRDECLAPWPRTPAIVRRHLADYYACIEFLDDQVGRILDALRASGRYDDTLIVYTSDHGLAIGSHGLFGKQNLYEHSMRSPLILAGPGVPRGRRSDAMTYLLDIFPTLGSLAGVPSPDGSEGLSLAPVLAGQVPTRRDSIFTAYGDSQRAIRDDRWKLIVYPRINRTQLFDLRDDPDERRDLSADPARAAEVARLTTLLRRSQEESGDRQPLSSPRPLPSEFVPPASGTE